MTLVKRLVKGSALTYAEADGNLDHFTNELALKADLEAELISGGETTVDGTTITVAAASWRVPPSVYAKVTETEFTGITYSGAGNQRYVAFYGNTSNTIVKVEGAEAVTAVLPTQPDNTALISYALVGDSSIGSPTQDLSGYQLKSDKSLDISTDQASDVKYPSVKAVYDWAVGLFQTLANKDATGGYAGLTLFKINFKNAANTFTSFLTNSNTAVRTYLFPDKDGTVAMLDDIPQSHYLGSYTSLANLQAAHPTANPGDEALVDAGVGEDALKYIWDDSDDAWIQGGGGSAASFATLTGSPSDNAALVSAINAKVEDTIANGVTDKAPSQNVVYDALALKADTSSIDASAIALPELGTIISDDFNRASLGSNWTSSGTGTFTIVSNQLQVAYSGSYATTNRVVYNAYGNSNLESFTLTSKVIAGTIDANSHGVGFGFEANSLYGLNSVRVNIRLNSANLGKIEYFSTGDGGNQTVSSPIGMTIVAGDILTVTIKFIKNKFITTVNNATTNVTNSFELDISTGVGYTFGIPNSYRFSIIAAGGTHLVDDFLVYSNDVKNASLLCVGDSITKGLTTSHITNRFSELINNVTNTITVTNAGSGNKIEDINTNEVLSLEPQKILVTIGINNIQHGDNLTTLQTKYTTLIDALVTGGYVVGTDLFIGTLLPHLTTDNAAITAFNSWLFTNYGTAAVIDLYSSMLNTAGDAISGSSTIDGIHPNDEGHKVLANLIIVKLNLLTKPKKIGNLYPVVYDANGKVSIASSKYKGSVPKSRLHVVDESGKCINVSNSNADSGLYLGSIGDGNGYQLAGAAYESGSYIAKASYAGGVLVHNGVTYFINKSGLTPGSSFGIDYSGTVTASKQWRLGDANTPHASAILDLNSSTNKGFLPPILTTTQRDAISSPSEGLMIFNTTTKKLNFYNGTAWEAVTSA